MFKQTREFLVQKGVRVDPSAQITLGSEDIEIGTVHVIFLVEYI